MPEGTGVPITGTIRFDGKATGRIRVDISRVVDLSRPTELVQTLELREFGAWSVEAPRDFGAITLVGFVDLTGNGPSPDDPAMRWDEVITVGTEPITGIDLVLDEEAGLSTGVLALPPGAPPAAEPPPGDPPSAAATAPPPDGEPLSAEDPGSAAPIAAAAAPDEPAPADGSP